MKVAFYCWVALIALSAIYFHPNLLNLSLVVYLLSTICKKLFDITYPEKKFQQALIIDQTQALIAIAIPQPGTT
ncbi:hypothetical protein [Nostoc sp. UHCC 0252]|uniref:hypothetical protein n=1 Tax=Nostoc sp. UHCC 0252 TaxID=3110241 RepID=UPI002B21C66F|nr:hypothetical protein [Nostoc sp. UHCC 0252]MEA5604804.1 hypothetical protein [Nostoc sp. UHCC 0252]